MLLKGLFICCDPLWSKQIEVPDEKDPGFDWAKLNTVGKTAHHLVWIILRNCLDVNVLTLVFNGLVIGTNGLK